MDTDTVMRISAKELRTHMRQLIARLARGEEVILTYRGRDAARIVPVEQPPATEASSEAVDKLFGLWRDREDLPHDVEAYVDELRRSRY